jgi:hypothetical protein
MTTAVTVAVAAAAPLKTATVDPLAKMAAPAFAEKPKTLTPIAVPLAVTDAAADT